jgi:iron complex outermembrane receptor protein
VQLLPPTSAAAAALGATPLRPEKSKSYSVGLVAQPIPGMNISVDLYQIKIRGRILQTATLGPSTAISNVLRTAGLNPNQAAFFYTNAANTRTRGVDFVADYRRDFGDIGTFKWTISANYNKGIFTSVIPPAFGVVLINRAAQGNFTDAQPKDKEIFSTEYTRGNFTANVRITRYGKLTTIAATPNLDDTISAAGLVDVDLSYQLTEAVRVAIGANNLLNHYPDLVQPNNRGGANPFSYFNQTSPYGIGGGFYYAKVNVEF